MNDYSDYSDYGMSASEYRRKTAFRNRESEAHFDAKLVVQSVVKRVWTRYGPIRSDHTNGATVVEYVYPVAHKAKGRLFSWSQLGVKFGPGNWLHENGFPHYPTAEAAFDSNLKPMFIFDVACESNLGISAVFELTATTAPTPQKRRFCAEHKIAFYDIDVLKLEAMVTRDGFSFRTDDGLPNRLDFLSHLPLIDGGWLHTWELTQHLIDYPDGVFKRLFPEEPR
jgi:hypothetical protein